jgi:hypothetical protein
VAQIVTSPQLTNELHNALVACVGDLCPRRDGDDWRLGGQRDALPDQSYPGPVWSLNPETLKTAPWNAQLLVWELGRAAAALEEGFPADGPDARRRLKTLGHEVACWVRDRQLALQQPGPHVVDRVEPMLVQAIFDVVAGRWEDLKSTGPAAIPWPERIGRRAPSALMGAALAGGAVWLWISGEQLAAVALASPALALLKSDDLATAAASALDDVRKIAKH